MGASLYVNSFKKDDEYILSEMESVGLYEVQLDKMNCYNHKSILGFWGTIYCFQELSMNVWSQLSLNDVYVSRSNIVFFDLIPCRMSGDNLSIIDNEPIGLMFAPEPILKITETILDNQKWLLTTFSPNTQKRIIETDELKKLNDLKELLNEAIEKDLIIGMQTG